MAIEVLLMNDVQHLGLAGDVKTVKDGYARNYLFPQGLAEPVTKNALRKLEKLRKEREELARQRKAEATEKAAKLSGKAVTIRARTTDVTKLYGSVGVAEIVAALAEEKVDVAASQVQLAEPIKETGDTDVVIKLFPEVEATVKVWVVAES